MSRYSRLTATPGLADVKNSDKGGAAGQWTGNKAGRMAQEYEKRGGDYEATEDAPNKAEKGLPEPKKKVLLHVLTNVERCGTPLTTECYCK